MTIILRFECLLTIKDVEEIDSLIPSPVGETILVECHEVYLTGRSSLGRREKHLKSKKGIGTG
jgi:hypothetical protein